MKKICRIVNKPSDKDDTTESTLHLDRKLKTGTQKQTTSTSGIGKINVSSMQKATCETNVKKRKASDVTRTREDENDDQVNRPTNENDGSKRKRNKQNYHRYIQKKMTPELFTDLVETLSDAQKDWVRKTGFGKLLDFHMTKYAHWLGYDIVESFDPHTSSLKLKNGSIIISDSVVHRVLGLPMGQKEITLDLSKEEFFTWGNQFKPTRPGNVFPWMVSDKIQNDQSVTKLFKLNFLVVMTNFLIESNQNSFMKRYILGFEGDLDMCSQYNWCGFLKQKLISTHKYWADKPTTRCFSGPLAFLTYLYVDRVESKVNSSVVRTIPSFIAWTDELIANEENKIRDDESFGECKVLAWTDNKAENKYGSDEHEAVITSCDKGDSREKQMEINGQVAGNKEDERTVKNKIEVHQKKQNTKKNALEGDDVDYQTNGITETEDVELDELIFMMSLEKKIDALGKRYRSCVSDIETAMEKYPNNPKITELKEKLRNTLVG